MDVATRAMTSLLPKLVELLDEKYKLQTSTREDVEYLSQEMKRMQAALLVVAEVPRDELDEQVKIWADEVRKLSYNMDVVVEEFQRPPDSEGCKWLMKRMDCLLKKGKTRRQIFTSAIKDIRAHAQGMAHQGNKIYDAAGYLDQHNQKHQTVTIVNPRPAGLHARGKFLVGIDGEQDNPRLIELLSHGDNMANRKLRTVSVVGFGGLGKTTLTKAVYEKIKVGFDCKAFVVAGQNAAVKRVLRDIIADLSMHESHLNRLDQPQLIEKLKDILYNKRYLIVVDDIWNGNLWEHIKSAFSTENNLGSRIITTTRVPSVSRVCCSSDNDSIYPMGPLTFDDSKKLWHDRIFGSVSTYSDEFEQVSTRILRKCGGVPLSIIAMASLLAGDTWMIPIDEWHAMLNKIPLRDGEWFENVQKILSFSYHELPLHLKTCSLYLSIFHVTQTIEKDRLVKKMIAEGIVTQEAKLSPALSLEEAASKYLDELIDRNVIQSLECNNSFQVLRYHIQPMMHDVLKHIAAEEKFAASLHHRDISSKIKKPSEKESDISSAHPMNFRYLSIDCPDSENLTDQSSMAFDHGVHSLTVFGHANQFLLRHFKGIRVLDLEGCESIDRADLEYICSMVLLKWLCLAKTQITELPPQIGKLQDLKGLDVGGTQITELPTQIGNLQYLERLYVGGTQITELPTQIGKLQHLKTLDARKSLVQEIPEQIVRLTGLVHLLIGDNESSEGVKLTLVRRSFRVPIIISGLCFLGMLDIRICKLEENDLKILRELPRLQSLIVRLEVLPTKMIRISCEGFAKLESFYVDCRMPMVVFEEGAMPKLEHLELKLYGGSTSEEHMDIKNLLCLQKVTLRYSKWYATNKGVRETTGAVKTECKEHQNEITLCIAEEDKDDQCIMKTEVFKENKDASCSRKTNIEEDEDTQEGGLHQSSHDIASCSGTSEIEEVVE